MKKKILGLATVALSLGMVLGGAPVSAWGPERPTYTMANPATKAVFNSITDNAAIGDERDFVRIAEVDSGKPFTSELILEPDKDYIVMIYYHNDASATFNDAAHDRVGIAQNTRVMSFFPEKLNKGQRGKVDGMITAERTDPESVWDEAYITAREAITLNYIEGSAVIRNQKASNGTLLSKDLFTDAGVLIGTNKLNGLMPGCDEYAGQVYYRIHTTAIETPDEPDPDPEPDPTPDPEEPTPEPENPEEPTPGPEQEKPQELPETGPAEVALAIVVVLALIAGIVYWRRTSHAVKKATRSAKGHGKRK